MSTEATTVPTVTIPRYDAPRITVTPVTEVIPSEPIDGRMSPGHYQHVLLDTRTGTLAFHESSEHREPWDPAWRAVNDVPRETWRRWHPGTAFSYRGPHAWFEPVPELLCWTIDSGVSQLPYLDVAAANALLAELTPYAQALLDGLYDVDGDLDWSAAAVRAGRNLGRLCSRYREAAGDDADADLIDYATIVERFPEAYQPELLGLSLDALADRCESITRFLGHNVHWHQHIKKVFGTPYPDGSGIALEVLGVRAWYRAALRDGDPRPLAEFAAWDAEHGRLATGEITSAMTDRELDAWIEREKRRAGANPGVRLLGTREATYAHRTRLREQDWDRLAVVGSHVARLEDELRAARAERLALVTRALSWGRPDAAIADRARMSRQAVHKIKNSGDETADNQEDQ